MTAPAQIELPRELLATAETMVRDGWARDLDTLLAEALRRYLDSHTARITEDFLEQDVEWGLHGDD